MKHCHVAKSLKKIESDHTTLSLTRPPNKNGYFNSNNTSKKNNNNKKLQLKKQTRLSEDWIIREQLSVSGLSILIWAIFSYNIFFHSKACDLNKNFNWNKNYKYAWPVLDVYGKQQSMHENMPSFRLNLYYTSQKSRNRDNSNELSKHFLNFNR